MNIHETIGKNMRAYRKHLGISQEKVAERCGLSRQYVSKLERGQSNIGIDNIELVCRALNIEIFQLLAEFDEEGYLATSSSCKLPKPEMVEAGEQDGAFLDEADFVSQNVPGGTSISVVFQEGSGMLQCVDIPHTESDLTLQTLINLQKKGYRGDYLVVRLRKMMPELIEVYKKYA